MVCGMGGGTTTAGSICRAGGGGKACFWKLLNLLRFLLRLLLGALLQPRLLCARLALLGSPRGAGFGWLATLGTGRLAVGKPGIDWLGTGGVSAGGMASTLTG